MGTAGADTALLKVAGEATAAVAAMRQTVAILLAAEAEQSATAVVEQSTVAGQFVPTEQFNPAGHVPVRVGRQPEAPVLPVPALPVPALPVPALPVAAVVVAVDGQVAAAVEGLADTTAATPTKSKR